MKFCFVLNHCAHLRQSSLWRSHVAQVITKLIRGSEFSTTRENCCMWPTVHHPFPPHSPATRPHRVFLPLRLPHTTAWTGNRLPLRHGTELFPLRLTSECIWISNRRNEHIRNLPLTCKLQQKRRPLTSQNCLSLENFCMYFKCRNYCKWIQIAFGFNSHSDKRSCWQHYAIPKPPFPLLPPWLGGLSLCAQFNCSSCSKLRLWPGQIRVGHRLPNNN